MSKLYSEIAALLKISKKKILNKKIRQIIIKVYIRTTVNFYTFDGSDIPLSLDITSFKSQSHFIHW